MDPQQTSHTQMEYIVAGTLAELHRGSLLAEARIVRTNNFRHLPLVEIIWSDHPPAGVQNGLSDLREQMLASPDGRTKYIAGGIVLGDNDPDYHDDGEVMNSVIENCITTESATLFSQNRQLIVRSLRPQLRHPAPYRISRGSGPFRRPTGSNQLRNNN